MSGKMSAEELDVIKNDYDFTAADDTENPPQWWIDLGKLLAHIAALESEQESFKREIAELQKVASDLGDESVSLRAANQVAVEALRALDEVDLNHVGYQRRISRIIRQALAQMEADQAEGSQGEIERLREALREDPSKWSFATLLTIGELILEGEYPPSIFPDVDPPDIETPSGDLGPWFIRALRAAIKANRAALERGERA